MLHLVSDTLYMTRKAHVDGWLSWWMDGNGGHCSWDKAVVCWFLVEMLTRSHLSLTPGVRVCASANVRECVYAWVQEEYGCWNWNHSASSLTTHFISGNCPYYVLRVQSLEFTVHSDGCSITKWVFITCHQHRRVERDRLNRNSRKRETIYYETARRAGGGLCSHLDKNHPRQDVPVRRLIMCIADKYDRCTRRQRGLSLPAIGPFTWMALASSRSSAIVTWAEWLKRKRCKKKEGKKKWIKEWKKEMNSCA